MSSVYPVVLIHAAPWCGGCKHMLAPDNLERLTKMVKTIHPRTQIRVVYHADFKNINKTDDYPPISHIPKFPLVTVTTSTNCTKRGTMNKVEVHEYKWNGSTLVASNQQETHIAFLTRAINSVMGLPAPAQQPAASVPVTRSAPVKSERRERSFRLVGIQE